MSWLGEQGRRARTLLQWRRNQRELEEEMRLHRELRARTEGAAAAGRKFGNELRLREKSLDVWGWSWLESLGQDLRHGLRRLTRTPAATGLALLSLALGIGANTTLFTLTDAVLLRPLPVPRPGQLVELITRERNANQAGPTAFSNPLWERLRDRQSALAGMLAWSDRGFELDSGAPRQLVDGIYASGTYFQTLGVQPERGRLLEPADDSRACAPVADISDGLWRSYFGGAASAVGATLTLNGQELQVIGVMPPGFFGAEPGWNLQIAVPLCDVAILSQFSGLLQEPNSWWLSVMGRLRPGESVRAASAQIAALMPALAPALPTGPDATGRRGMQILVQPAAQGASWTWVRMRYGSALLVLLALAMVVLLVACTNLAGLMLARAAAQREEIAVRLSLGATRFRLVRQQMMESLLLAAGGMALGAAFAIWASQSLEQFASQGASLTLSLAPDSRVLEFALGITLATALLVGLGPALRATRVAAATAPRPLSGTAPLAGRWSASLQVALAFVLLAGGVLFARNFTNLVGPAKGFSTHNILLATAMAPRGHPVPPATLDALRGLPGVQMASASLVVPAQGSSWGGRVYPLGVKAGERQTIEVFLNAVAPGFFGAVGTPLLRGRDFSRSDMAQSPQVAIMNQVLARRLFPGGDALGREVIDLSPAGKPSTPVTIVGIVADAKYYRLQAAPPLTLYFPIAQNAPSATRETFYIRSRLPESALAPAVRQALAREAPDAQLQIESYDTLVDGAVRPQQLLALLGSLFGALALLVAAIGVYGVLAYSAAQRRKEYGIRAALGAKPSAIAKLALGEAATMLAVGGIAGAALLWLASLTARPMLQTLLYRLGPGDPATLGGAATLLTAVALAAAWLPARRAAHADPLAALREE